MYSHSVPLSNSVVTGCKPKVVRFLRVLISDRFRRTRTLCFVIPLSQHSLHCDLWTAHKTSRSHQSLHHLLISLEPVLKTATVAGYASFRRFVKVCMTLATRCWEIWAQQRLRRSFRLSISWIFTAHRRLQLSSDEELRDLSLGSSEVKPPAWGIAGRRGPGSPGSADSDRKATSRN